MCVCVRVVAATGPEPADAAAEASALSATGAGCRFGSSAPGPHRTAHRSCSSKHTQPAGAESLLL